MTRNCDPGRYLRGGEQPLDVRSDGLGGFQDRQGGEHILVVARSLGEPMPELLVSKEPATAVGVVDDRRLKVRAFGCLGLDEVRDVGEVLDYQRRHPATHGATHDRVGELQPEKFKGINPRVDTGDDVQPLVRQER